MHFPFLCKNLLLPAAFCLFVFSAAAQIALENKTELPRVKNSVTYIAMKDTASAIAQPYKDVFRKYWTYSKIQFIEYKDILNYVSPEASFFTIGGFTTNSTFVHMTAGGGRREGLSYENTHLYYELWVCDQKQLEKWKNRKKKKDELPDAVKTVIARIELFTDFETLAQPDNIYASDYDGGGHIRNWGPGYLKNYVQLLTSLLEKGETRTLFKPATIPAQLKSIKKQTLYIPDYVLIKFNKFSGDESKRHDEKELLQEYKWPYQLIGNAALNQKIMADEELFYHLVYIKSSTDKYVSVLNARTGELVYSVYTPISYNIKEIDFAKLYNAVRKGEQ